VAVSPAVLRYPATPSQRETAAEPAPQRGVTRIVQTDQLPAGIGALAVADGGTVYVSSSLGAAARRAALRHALRPAPAGVPGSVPPTS